LQGLRGNAHSEDLTLTPAISGEDSPSRPTSGETQRWTRIVTAKRSALSIPIGELWSYRDLLLLLVYRDFVAMYKQTILGPLWFVIQPVLTAIVFTVVFGNIAKIPTDGLPQLLFYLAGLTCWNYFSETLTKTSETFTTNAAVFGKVYFPRMIVPLSIVISNLLKFVVQLAIFLAFAGWFWWMGVPVRPNVSLLLLPLVILTMGILGLGLGMIISALTTKYRDLRFLLAFGVQLMMYATPIIYPLSAIPERYRVLVSLNPITPLIECFRYGFLGAGTFDLPHLLYALVASCIILAVAMIVFNQIENTFMDTV
jgi:lipopolysaccharide transport system permease protein